MNLTKTAIMKSFWSLLEEKNYNKITVNDIVEKCQLNRNTFYYYFHDIPELLTFILESATDEIFKKYAPFEDPMDCVNPLIDLALKNQAPIMHIYHSVQRDIFISKLDLISYHIAKEYINNLSKKININQDDKYFLIRFYKCLIVGVTLDWLRAGLNYDLSLYLKKVFKLFKNAQHSPLSNISKSKTQE